MSRFKHNATIDAKAIAIPPVFSENSRVKEWKEQKMPLTLDLAFNLFPTTFSSLPVPETAPMK